MITSRNIFVAVAIVLQSLGFVSSLNAEFMRKPNLLIVHTNEQTFRSISSYDNSWGDLETPHIDFLANNGARFENFYTNHPLCTPSRAALLTGKYAQRVGAYYNELPLDEGAQTIGHRMQNQGFVTGYSGKVHLVGGVHPGFSPPRDFGFSDNRFMWNNGPYKTITIDENGYLHGSREVGDESSYGTDFLKDRTIEFIEKNKNQEWCYMLSFPNPRDPNLNRSPYDTMYNGEDMILPDTFLLPEDATSNWKPFLLSSRQSDLSHEAYLREYKAQYFGMIKHIDDCVGEILDSLRQSGLLEVTIIVFTTDQGEMMGEFSRYDKEVFHAASAKIPFIVYYPEKIKPNTVVREVVSNIDFVPTMLDIMEVPYEKSEFDGRSAAQLSMGASDEYWRNTAYLSQRNMVGVVTERFKLIVASKQEPILIDLLNDPDEYDNAINKSEFREDVKRLTTNLKNYLEYTFDPNWTDGLTRVFEKQFEQHQTFRAPEIQNARKRDRRWKEELALKLNQLEGN